MISILFLLSIVWLGFVLDEEFSLSRGDFLLRLAAAIVLGCFWGAWVVFLLALGFGFSVRTVVVGMGLILVFDVLAWRFRHRDLAWFTPLLVFDRRFWLAAFVPTVSITAYFALCVWIDGDGNILYHGNSVDLAPHMGIAGAFLDQTAFPPLNPHSAALTLNYHFMADFFSAILCRGGFSLFYSLKIPMVLLAFSLCSLTCHVLFSVLRSLTATVFAGLMFFFGHIGVINLLFGLAGYPSGDAPLSLRSWKSIEYHLTFPYFNFLNIVIDFFQPQLPFLFGWALAMLILAAIYRKYSQQAPFDRSTCFLLALIAFLPLFHMHTFLTISPLVGLLVLIERAPSRALTDPRDGLIPRLFRLTTGSEFAAQTGPSQNAEAAPRSSGRWFNSPYAWLKILALVVAAIPVGLQLGWVFSQSHPAGYSGFDVAERIDSRLEIPDFLHLQRCWFWLRTAGPPFLLGLPGVVFSFRLLRSGAKSDRRGELALLALLSVTGSYFLLINFYRFTPNWGDSNKFVLYLDLALCIYAGRLLAFWWNRSLLGRVAAGMLVLLGAVLPTTIDHVSGILREPDRLFNDCDQLVATWIRLNTPPDAVFLTANSTAHLVPALARRRVVNGANTRSNGYADEATELLVARAFRESNPYLITSSHVAYVFVGPQEEEEFRVNRAALGRCLKLVYDQRCKGVRHSVYEVSKDGYETVRRERESVVSRPFAWLSELEPAFVRQFGVLRYDESFDQTPLILHGHRYDSGLGTHAISEIRFDLDQAYSSFESDIGLDDSKMGGVGTAVFQVWVDDRKVYESKTMRAGDSPESIRMDITGATTLKLIVTDAGDGSQDDNADWAGARLIKKQ
jgi:hypothetical protein